MKHHNFLKDKPSKYSYLSYKAASLIRVLRYESSILVTLLHYVNQSVVFNEESTFWLFRDTGNPDLGLPLHPTIRPNKPAASCDEHQNSAPLRLSCSALLAVIKPKSFIKSGDRHCRGVSFREGLKSNLCRTKVCINVSNISLALFLLPSLGFRCCFVFYS